jgi:epoxyqueuosine reductase
MLLLHTCCADCTLKFIESIHADKLMEKEEIHLYYYNPNIHPQSEFTARQMALKKIADGKHVKLIVENWTPDEYFKVQESLTQSERFDRKKRCPNCWRLRLAKVFAYAKDHGYTTVSSTIITSSYMDKNKITIIAEELEKKSGIQFYIPKHIECNIKTSGFYKQNYCGCVYSLLERLQEKHGIQTK